MTNTTTRMSPRARHDSILSAAVRLAEMKGYQRITRDDIALAAECSPALVSLTLGTMVQLRRQVQRYAIANEILPVIAQGLAARDPHAMRAPEHLRRLAAESLI